MNTGRAGAEKEAVTRVDRIDGAWMESDDEHLGEWFSGVDDTKDICTSKFRPGVTVGVKFAMTRLSLCYRQKHGQNLANFRAV